MATDAEHEQPPNRNIVVIGASAGGVTALLRLVAKLSKGLPAAVFVVQHIAPDFVSQLPQLLTSNGPLSASHAVDGEPIVPGRIYVSPPGKHLLVADGRVQVERCPQVTPNRHSIDALFRSAARTYGPRVIGVVLTGSRDDGAAGLASIASAGGVTLVQDPRLRAEPSGQIRGDLGFTGRRPDP